MSIIARRLTAALVVVAILSGPIAAFGASANAPSFVADTAHAAAAVHRRTNHVLGAAEAEVTPAAGGDLASSTQDESSPPTEEVPPTGDDASGADTAPPPAEVPSDPGGEEPPAAETATDPADVVVGETDSEPVPTEQPPVDAETDEPTTAPEPLASDVQADVDESEVERLAANQPPVAAADAFTTAQETTLSVDIPGVLANDADADGDALTAVLETATANGTLGFLTPDGGFSYSPNVSFFGDDTFTYRVSDGTDTSDPTTVTITVVPASTPPISVADAYSVAQDTILEVDAVSGVLANDSDPDGDPLRAFFELGSGPSNGRMSGFGLDGSFTYTPNSGFSGTDAFRYQAFDGTVHADPVTVTITVTPAGANSPPVAVDDSYTVAKDTVLTLDAASGPLANDSDPDGDALFAFNDFPAPSHGVVDSSADGSFTYEPDTHFTGTDTFGYGVTDRTDRDSGVVTVTVTGEPNEPPVAVDDAYSVIQDTTLTIDAAAGLVANDTDANGDALFAFNDVPAPSHGVINSVADGSFTYTPDAGFVGTDTFGYGVTDRALSDSGVITITVTAAGVNTPPVAVDDTYTVTKDGVLTVAAAEGVLANDTDLEGDELFASLDFPANGQLQSGIDGSFTYAPGFHFTGTDTFTYFAHEAGNTNQSNVATVTITVTGDPNVAPEAADDGYSVAQDSTLSIDAASGVLANDSDPNGDSIRATAFTPPLHGTLTTADDGSFLYTPATGFAGMDSFAYEATDGATFSNAATVTITVTATGANTPPIATDDAYAVAKDTTLVVDAASGLLINDEDVDGDPLLAELQAAPANGTVAFNGPGGFTGDGGFTYTPNAGFVGADSFAYFVSDGTALSFSATVTVVVTDPATNKPPIAVDDAYATPQDTTLTVDAASGLLGNDTDDNGAAVLAELQTAPSHGTVTLNGPGGFVGDGSFVYIPDPGFAGTDSFQYFVSDGLALSFSATVTITVTAVGTNSPPVGVPDSYRVDKDGKLLVDAATGVLANDTDADGDPLVVSSSTLTDHGILVQATTDGSFRYEPNTGFVGTDTFVYRASDGTASSADTLVTITVRDPATNRAPFAADDAFSTSQDTLLVADAPGILANDSDPDGDAIEVFTLFNLPQHGVVDALGDGSFVYTPEAGFFGADTFVYQITDGQSANALSDRATVTITVGNASGNTPPTAFADTFSVANDSVLAVDAASGLLSNDFDFDGDPIVVTGATLPLVGTLKVNADGGITYSPQTGFVGTTSFTYFIADGHGGTDAGVSTVTVTPAVNEPPVANDDAYSTFRDTQLLVDKTSGLLANDTDPDGDPLATFATDPSNGTVTIFDGGGFRYTPDAGFVGTDSFTYQANDGHLTGFSNTATVTIVVKDPADNTAPVANDDSYTAFQDTSLVVTAADGLLANDTDADGDALVATGQMVPAHGQIDVSGQADGAAGGFVYTPDPGFVGTETFEYRAFDGAEFSEPAAFTITVIDDHLPVAVDDAYRTNAGTSLTVDAATGLLANDSDLEGDALTAVEFSDPGHGTLTVDADGSFTYAPDAGFSGTDSFTYSVTDGTGASEPATVTLTVNNTPVANDDHFTTPVNTVLAIGPAAGLLANDTDADGDALVATGQMVPAHGQIDVSGQADGAAGGFVYTPDPGFVGTETFEYRAFDGAEFSEPAAFTITVGDPSAGNTAPVAVDDLVTTLQDTAIVIDALVNDSDPDGDAISFSGVVGGDHGAVDFPGNGTVRYTPDAGFVGTDSFIYQVTDGTDLSNVATVTITVTASGGGNTPPVAEDDAFAAIADAPFTVNAPGLLANDADADADLLAVEDVVAPDHGTVLVEADGAFTYTPEPGFVGTAIFAYTVVDHRGGSDTAEVAIAVGGAANTPPVGGDDAFTVTQDTALVVVAPGVLANDSDADGDPLKASVNLGGLPQHGAITLEPDGGFTYTPEPGFVGLDGFTYAPFDPFGSGNLTQVDITVSPAAANTTPVANDDAYATAQDTPLIVDAPGVLANDTDADGQTLVVSGIGVIQHGTVTPGADGSFDFVPDPGFVGTASFQYIASDGVLGGESNLATVTIAVGDAAADNTPPVAADDAYAVAQNVQLTVPTKSGLLANDSDADGDQLTIEDVADPQNGTVSFSADGSFIYTPDSGFIGSDIFEYVSSDGRGGHGNGIVEITVEAASPSPEPSPQPLPSPEPSPDPSPAPSPAPSPSPDPSPEPSPDPSTDPSPEPDTSPSPAPSGEPSSEPPVTTPDQGAPDGATEPTEPGEPANEQTSGILDSTAPDGSHVPAAAESGPNSHPAEAAYDVEAFPNTGAGEAAQSKAAGPPLWLTILLALAILAVAGAGAAIHRRSSH